MNAAGLARAAGNWRAARAATTGKVEYDPSPSHRRLGLVPIRRDRTRRCVQFLRQEFWELDPAYA